MLPCVQGVKQRYSTGEEHFLLCDPAIHCESDLKRFCNTNLGKFGYDSFFKTHKCNHICRQLGLDAAPGATGCAHTHMGTMLSGGVVG